MQRTFSAPEFVQTSGMDCGPAVICSLLNGYHIPADYAHMRTLCGTDVDGTSIDDLEQVARDFGLDVSQIMLPVEHVLTKSSGVLPAIVVTLLPDGFTHFVLVWRIRGQWVDIMDPAVGRRRVKRDEFLKTIYVHSQTVARRAWQEWATSESNVEPFAERLAAAGVTGALHRSTVTQLTSGSDLADLQRLEGSLVLVEKLRRKGASRRECRTLFSGVKNCGDYDELRAPYLSAYSAHNDSESDLVVRGAVLIRCRGLNEAGHETLEDASSGAKFRSKERHDEPHRRMVRELLTLPIGLIVFATLLGLYGVLEGVFLRALVDIGRDLVLPEQRALALGGGIAFLGIGFMLERLVALQSAAAGRRLEGDLRLRIYQKLPRLKENYTATRSSSDTLDRVHSIQHLRLGPALRTELIRTAVALVATSAAVCVLEPSQWPMVCGMAVLVICFPLPFLSELRELDLRARVHAASLSLACYEALRGHSALLAHRAHSVVEQQHERLMDEWHRAALRFLRRSLWIEGCQAVISFAFIAWIVFSSSSSEVRASTALLLAYWLLTIPSLGERLLQLFRRFPSQRNIFRRVLEPLLADEIEAPAESNRQASEFPVNEGVELFVNGASVALAGRTVLENVHLRLGAGEQVAIVGVSGSGKSTLLGLLMGLKQPDRGQVLWDGEALTAIGCDRLYESTVWIDPSVRLWNRSLLENVLYGAVGANIASTTEAIADAQLDQIIGNAPQGLRSLIGEAGVTLSGGEGQRTRFARGLIRENPRFVVLDEPFRGLDHSTRKEFLALSRRRWRNATMICVTHDIAETLEFDRVIVLQDGRVIEDGDPQTLSEVPTSVYRRLLDAERVACRDTWGAATWRRVRLDEGAIANRKTCEEIRSPRDELTQRASFPHVVEDRHEKS